MASKPGSTGEVELVLDAKASTAESPTWSERDRALYWIDIEEPALHRWDPRSGEDRRWAMPSEIGSFALTQSGSALAALRTGLASVDLARGSVTLLAPPPYDPLTHRFNAGQCDAAGRFWIGTMAKPAPETAGRSEPNGAELAKPIHVYDVQNGLKPVDVRAAIANGFVWSPDNRTMYVTDTEARTIHAYDFDPERAELSRPRVFKRFEPAEGGPDGAAIDADGFYWCALHGGGRVVRLDPDGRVERDVRLPVSQPTMCAFGGADLDILYVTSASNGLDAEARRREPQAGGLFGHRPGVRGRRPNLFLDKFL